jgi:hypothetical protein
MLAPVTNAFFRLTEPDLEKLDLKNVGEDYLILCRLCAARRSAQASVTAPMLCPRNPHKHRDFHQNIPLAAQRNREIISSTEEQSSRGESRKRPSRALATVLTTRRETGGRMQAASKLLQRV